MLPAYQFRYQSINIRYAIMKKQKPFKIRRKKNSLVFITKLESTEEYFEENHSSYVVVDIADDLPVIEKAIEALRSNPSFEKISFFCHNAFVLPVELKNAMNDFMDDSLHEKIYGRGTSGYMPILMPDISGIYTLTLTYATVLRLGESDLFELYYEGFVETWGRIHIESARMDLLPLLARIKQTAPLSMQTAI